MSKVVYFSVPLSGHVNPSIGVVEALSDKGVEVVFYTSKEIFKKLEHIENVRLKAYPKNFQDFFDYIGNHRENHHKLLYILSTFFKDMELVMDFAIEELQREQPKLTICDQFALWGKAASRYCNIPYSLFFSSIMGDKIATDAEPFLKGSVVQMVLTQFPSMIDIIKIVGRLRKKYGNVIDDIGTVLDHNNVFTMVMTSKEFHPGGENYPNTVHFIGGDHIPSEPICDKKDTIFLSLGTVSLRENFFEDCIDAAEGLGYKIAITLAGNKNHKISPSKITDNVTVYDNLNFEEYRKMVNQSALFISHGGFNGITTALLYDTPVIVCPASSEQINNAKLIEKYNCGKAYFKKEIIVSEMRGKMSYILNSDEVKKSVHFHGKALRESLGYKGVVEIMCTEFGLLSNNKKEELGVE